MRNRLELIFTIFEDFQIFISLKFWSKNYNLWDLFELLSWQKSWFLWTLRFFGNVTNLNLRNVPKNNNRNRVTEITSVIRISITRHQDLRGHAWIVCPWYFRTNLFDFRYFLLNFDTIYDAVQARELCSSWWFPIAVPTCSNRVVNEIFYGIRCTIDHIFGRICLIFGTFY